MNNDDVRESGCNTENVSLCHPGWMRSVIGMFTGGSAETGNYSSQLFTDFRNRSQIVAKIRWLLIVLISLYGLFSGGLYFLSSFGFFLSFSQKSVVFLSLIAVACYNSILSYPCNALQRFSWINHAQILLDTLFVTILVHFSGGASSWFWPVYLVIAIEATFLLERNTEIWLVGATGNLLFGALLTGEYFELIPSAGMPFVNAGLHHDALYMFLVWMWVAILNATVTIIGSFLMSVIRRENRALHDAEQYLTNFLDSAYDLIFSFGPDGEFHYVNSSWRHTLGYTVDDIERLTIQNIVHPASRKKCIAAFERIQHGETSTFIDAELIGKDARIIAVEGTLTGGFKDGSAKIVWGICRDVSERRQAQDQLYRLAHHDILTGLPNRILFLDRLQQARALAQRLRLHAAVLFLDLDRFKVINDTLGHALGDKLLQAVARRICGCVREIDTVARIGGDEFTVIIVNLTDPKDIEKVASKILLSLSQPQVIDGHELFISTSIGISIFPDDSEDLDSLVKKADIAMYYAKAQGRNNFQYYNNFMDENAQRRLSLENNLRRAVELDELKIYYQPKVDIACGSITSMEALLRWEHGDMGLLPASEFISLAEETGLIIPIGEWVLKKACEQSREWQELGLTPIRIAVNVSGYQLQKSGFRDDVKRILMETGLDAQYLELEITESVIMQRPELTMSILRELRELGVHISIDDFGTGYSSLANLKSLSVNTLKIDKAFVRDVEVNSTDAAIATAIIAMGKSLNLNVIAEGVETDGQLSFLRDRNCNEIQGYLFSKPLPPERAMEFLLRRPGLPDEASEGISTPG